MGKKFRGAHVHSILKKKRMRDEQLEREYPEVWSDFYLDGFNEHKPFLYISVFSN